MRLVLAGLCLAALAATGCVMQPPYQQLSVAPVARLCNGNQCWDQPSYATTFQGEPVNPESERRMAALTALAERDPRAAYDLGLRLLRGDGVERNTYQAIEWMRKAGDHGDGAAQMALGRLYLLGFEEMGPDPAEAEAWLTRAAAKGNQEAKRLLPQARAAKKKVQDNYQARDEIRKSWDGWYVGAPYYWSWAPSGWFLR
jgi:TPR repeat protein